MDAWGFRNDGQTSSLPSFVTGPTPQWPRRIPPGGIEPAPLPPSKREYIQARRSLPPRKRSPEFSPFREPGGGFGCPGCEDCVYRVIEGCPFLQGGESHSGCDPSIACTAGVGDCGAVCDPGGLGVFWFVPAILLVAGSVGAVLLYNARQLVEANNQPVTDALAIEAERQRQMVEIAQQRAAGTIDDEGASFLQELIGSAPKKSGVATWFQDMGPGMAAGIATTVGAAILLKWLIK